MTLVSRSIVALLMCCSLAVAAETPAAAPPLTDKPLIQLALLLDTSNSMDGLIDQARSQLWTVVNHVAKTNKDGQTPRLEVALYEYGNDGLAADSGYVRQVLAFTEDLDSVSEKLFGLRTNGGQEYCGQVIATAMKDLKWSTEAGVYKTIFIAGNEPFTQGTVDYHGVCESAHARNVAINTIHCGSEQDGVNGQWNEGARLGGGKYLCINQNKAILAIASPQDAEIARLSGELNKTYLPFGAEGANYAHRQAAQDLAAVNTPAAAAAGAPVQRAVSKANSLYKNSQWDLVDAVVTEKTTKLEDVKEAELPENMRGMDMKQRKAYVESQAKARTETQKQINQLNGEREKFVAEKRREAAAREGKDGLDAAILSAVDEQLSANKFEKAE